MKRRPLVLSLGAGVQSSTLALMAEHGLVERPDVAIFADTQSEPQEVYDWLKWLSMEVSFLVEIVTAGSLEQEILRVVEAKDGHTYSKSGMIPAFTKRVDGHASIMSRWCTSNYKIVPITKKINKMFGKRDVIQQIGISKDESQRMKPSRYPNIQLVWPLIELSMTRQDCKDWMKVNGYPEPPRSSCYFCPFHNDAEWVRMRDEHPLEFSRAVEFERKFQNSHKQGDYTFSEAFLHPSLVDLDKVNFKEPNRENRMINECEGMCGQ